MSLKYRTKDMIQSEQQRRKKKDLEKGEHSQGPTGQ